MAIAQVTVVPLGTGTTSVSRYVAEVAAWLEKNGIKYHLTPMGTVLEGETRDLLDIVAQMHEQPFSIGAERVMTLVNLDDRRDKKNTAMGKVASVKARLESRES